MACFSVAQLLLAPVWGRLSDRFGRKPVLLVSLLGTALGSLATGLAGSLALLFVGRIVDGASGASVSVAQAAVADIARPEQRARLYGLLGAAFGLGFVVGPALGALAALGSPSLPFFLAAGLAAGNAAVAVRRLPETRPDGEAPAGGDSSPDEAGGGVAPRVGPLLAVAFISLVAFSAFETTFALFGERRLGFTLASTGAVFAGVGLVLAAVQSLLVRPVVRRLGEGATLRLGLGLNAAGLVVLAGVRSWWSLIPALGALVVGQGLAMPALTSVVAASARAHRRGRAFGLQQSAGGLARVIGPLTGGYLFGHYGPGWPYLGGAVLTVLAVGLVGRTGAVVRSTAGSQVDLS